MKYDIQVILTPDNLLPWVVTVRDEQGHQVARPKHAETHWGAKRAGKKIARNHSKHHNERFTYQP